MNDPISFSGCDIGRELSFPPTHSTPPQSFLLRGCAPSPALDTDAAAHFSRAFGSHLELRLPTPDDNFALALKFRTYDQDGLIMASEDNGNELLLYLQDTELRVDYVHRGDTRSVEVTDRYSNGRWKDVSLVKEGALLSLLVDGRPRAAMNVPRRMRLGRTMWLGGRNGEMEGSPGFDGCIGDLRLAGRPIPMAGIGVRHAKAVKACAEEVERGFLLSGDGLIEIRFEDGWMRPSSGLIQLQLFYRGHNVKERGILLEMRAENGNTLTFVSSNDHKVTFKSSYNHRLTFVVLSWHYQSMEKSAPHFPFSLRARRIVGIRC